MIEAFPTDTSKTSLEKAFQDIRSHDSFKNLKLELAIYSIKHSSKKPFLEETREEFEESLEVYVGGAFTFAQESLKRFFADHGDRGLDQGGEKKGVFHTCSQKMAHTDLLCRHSYLLEPLERFAATHNLPPMVQAALLCDS